MRYEENEIQVNISNSIFVRILVNKGVFVKVKTLNPLMPSFY